MTDTHKKILWELVPQMIIGIITVWSYVRWGWEAALLIASIPVFTEITGIYRKEDEPKHE